MLSFYTVALTHGPTCWCGRCPRRDHTPAHAHVRGCRSDETSALDAGKVKTEPADAQAAHVDSDHDGDHDARGAAPAAAEEEETGRAVNVDEGGGEADSAGYDDDGDGDGDGDRDRQVEMETGFGEPAADGGAVGGAAQGSWVWGMLTAPFKAFF